MCLECCLAFNHFHFIPCPVKKSWQNARCQGKGKTYHWLLQNRTWEQKQLRFGLLPPSVVWPDEKVFAVEAKFNQQNDRIYCMCKTSPTT